jgi:hypothetical protein
MLSVSTLSAETTFETAAYDRFDKSITFGDAGTAEAPISSADFTVVASSFCSSSSLRSGTRHQFSPRNGGSSPPGFYAGHAQTDSPHLADYGRVPGSTVRRVLKGAKDIAKFQPANPAGSIAAAAAT